MRVSHHGAVPHLTSHLHHLDLDDGSDVVGDVIGVGGTAAVAP